ncbi:hypothetical protein KDW_47960 [Dictyobacter vulcani]|uniref:Uncharacterized protein n=1 Tax=Dictyobacter vulcani TaxID=2607529 RepID=A0A5J4KMN8_9CHLR|nr:hypothetical protein [Dictyobacter vulcani]GER90634.1 hypothetical protein KDW_47960 [Dictyobacter vulcani]
MKTFTQTKEIFIDAIEQLKRLEGPEKVTKALRTLKEREAGKLCYQAEEDLPQAELVLLKDRLKVGKTTWERYKHIFLESMLKRK